MKQTVLQESFSAGEISPLSRSRYGSEGYAQGCEILENMYANPRGPAENRGGSKHLVRLAGNDARTEYILLESIESAVLILTDLKLTVTGLVGRFSDNNQVPDARFRNTPSSWAIATVDGGNVFLSNDTCLLRTDDRGTSLARISQTITSTVNNYVFVAHSNGAASYRVQIGTAIGDGSYLDEITSELEFNRDVAIGVVNPFITITSVDPDSSVIISYIGLSLTLNDYSVATPWKETDIHDVHLVPLPDASELIFLHPHYTPKKLSYVYSSEQWTFADVAFTSKPADWVSFSYPSSGSVFQGRLWLGGTPKKPQTFWGSKSGVYIDFTTGAGAADALEFTMQKYGPIKWIIGTKNLLIGTSNGEHIVTSEGGVIHGADIEIEQQSSYGSSNVQPRIVGDQVFYISPDRRKLRAMQYEWTSNNWLSRDLTFFSQHITEGLVNGMAWAQHPGNLLFMVMKSGYFGAMNYERGENKWGWHRHLTQGEYKSVSSGMVNGNSIIVAAVKHVNDFIDIESIVVEGGQLMDSWIEKESPTPFTTVDGLSHLEGEIVQVITDDGAVHPDKTVSGGAITLDYSASKVIVGLNFTPKLKLLPFEKGVGGSDVSVPYEKNFHSIDVHILESANPLINGTRAPSRSPATPMGTPEPLTSGKVRVSDCGWDNETDITIEQDLPLPLIVTAVSGEIAQEKL